MFLYFSVSVKNILFFHTYIFLMELATCIPSPPSMQIYTQYNWQRFVCWWCFNMHTVDLGRFEPEQQTAVQAGSTSRALLETPFYCVPCLCDKDHPRSPEHAVIQKDGTILVRKKVNHNRKHQNTHQNNTRICTYCINCNIHRTSASEDQHPQPSGVSNVTSNRVDSRSDFQKNNIPHMCFRFMV